MADPFLAAHRIAPGTFSLAGRLHPISIRDQMIRGQLFARRAFREGLIHRSTGAASDPPSLVVVGAGVAGATVAIEAADQGVKTVVIERAPQAFATQSSCTTRWIDPTQYDWPLAHWNVGHYPWNATLVPTFLPWPSPASAHTLAVAWQQELAKHIGRLSSHLTYRPQATLTDVQPAPTSNQVIALIDDALRPGPNSMTCDVVLIATGFGRESCNLGDEYHRHAPRRHATEGIPFWADDDLGKPDFGLGPRAVRVLISGAGDGALQDFLRVATDPAKVRSAKEIFDRILGLPRPPPPWWSEIQDALDQVDRQGIWGTRHDDHGALEYLHGTIDRVVSTLLADPTVRSRIVSILRDPPPEVYLVYTCSHFGRGYVLNRLLALLLAGHLGSSPPRRIGAPPLLNPCRRVVNLDPIPPHVCGVAPCYGHAHTFELARTNDCVRDEPLATDGQPYAGPSQTIGVASTGAAEILILHHGPRFTHLSRALQQLHGPPSARQLLPYGLLP
jgi:hypothetical protein